MLWLIFKKSSKKDMIIPIQQMRNERLYAPFLKITQLEHSGVGFELGIDSEV